MSDATVRSIFDAERDRLARATRMGIGMPIAGLVYWLAFAVLLRAMPLPSALLTAFIATGAVFPLGWLFTRLAGGDLMAKSASLTSLGMMLNAVQLLLWPAVVLVRVVAIEWTPFAMAILFGSHFLPYAWFYRCRGYLVLSVGVAVALSVAALATRSAMTEAVPLIAAGCYAVAVAVLAYDLKLRLRAPSPIPGTAVSQPG